MNDYENKHLINQGPPDDFDLDDCPVYQAYMAKCDQERIKQQMRDELNQDIQEFNKVAQ